MPPVASKVLRSRPPINKALNVLIERLDPRPHLERVKRDKVQVFPDHPSRCLKITPDIPGRDRHLLSLGVSDLIVQGLERATRDPSLPGLINRVNAAARDRPPFVVPIDRES
jgi:hypothetical protein